VAARELASGLAMPLEMPLPLVMAMAIELVAATL